MRALTWTEVCELKVLSNVNSPVVGRLRRGDEQVVKKLPRAYLGPSNSVNLSLFHALGEEDRNGSLLTLRMVQCSKPTDMAGRILESKKWIIGWIALV
jgi:hypothetical protein